MYHSDEIKQQQLEQQQQNKEIKTALQEYAKLKYEKIDKDLIKNLKKEDLLTFGPPQDYIPRLEQKKDDFFYSITPIREYLSGLFKEVLPKNKTTEICDNLTSVLKQFNEMQKQLNEDKKNDLNTLFKQQKDFILNGPKDEAAIDKERKLFNHVEEQLKYYYKIRALEMVDKLVQFMQKIPIDIGNPAATVLIQKKLELTHVSLQDFMEKKNVDTYLEDMSVIYKILTPTITNEDNLKGDLENPEDGMNELKQRNFQRRENILKQQEQEIMQINHSLNKVKYWIQRFDAMNAMNIESSQMPTILSTKQIEGFQDTLSKELHEHKEVLLKTMSQQSQDDKQVMKVGQKSEKGSPSPSPKR